jgi:hypothetical protein
MKQDCSFIFDGIFEAKAMVRELCHSLFLNSGMPLALEDGNSRNYMA